MDLNNLHPSLKNLLEKEIGKVEIFECDSIFSDTELFCNEYEFLLEDSCNAILIKSKKPEIYYSMFCILGNNRLDVNGKVKKALNAKRVSFASKDEAEEISKQIYGGISPLGLGKGIDIYIDENILKRDKVFIGGGNRTTKIFLSPTELIRLTNGTVMDLAQSRPA